MSATYLKPLDENSFAADDCYWIGNPQCDSPGPVEKLLIDNRSEIFLIGVITDAEADYSYDDYALILFQGSYYLLNTSGCSCPSPSETWGVSEGPLTLNEMEAKFKAYPGDPKGYGVTNRQAGEFMALITEARYHE